MSSPTIEGLRRYPKTAGHYTPQLQDAIRYSCTCEPSCAHPCKGACGCKACDFAWQDFLARELKRSG